MVFGSKAPRSWLLGALTAVLAVMSLAPTVRAAADDPRADGNLETGYSYIDSKDPLGPAPGTWDEITPPGNGAGGNALAIADQDDGSVPVPAGVGFDFVYWGQPVNNVRVCANGFLNFGVDNTGFDNEVGIPHPDLPLYSIFPFWDDLFLPNAAGGNGGVSTVVRGAAPNRQFVVEWSNVTFFNDQQGQFSSVTFEVVLFETSNDIEFRYHDCRGPQGHGESATVGLQDETGLFGNQYELDADPAENLLFSGLVIHWHSFSRTVGEPRNNAANPPVIPRGVNNDARNRTGSGKTHHICFITNAAYGTPVSEEVQLLSRFRDVFLMPTGPGRSFIDFYYKSSPPLARLVSEEEGLRVPLQLALRPPIWFARFMLFSTAAEKACAAGLVFLVGMLIGRAMCRRLAETER